MLIRLTHLSILILSHKFSFPVYFLNYIITLTYIPNKYNNIHSIYQLGDSQRQVLYPRHSILFFYRQLCMYQLKIRKNVIKMIIRA